MPWLPYSGSKNKMKKRKRGLVLLFIITIILFWNQNTPKWNFLFSSLYPFTSSPSGHHGEQSGSINFIPSIRYLCTSLNFSWDTVQVISASSCMIINLHWPFAASTLTCPCLFCTGEMRSGPSTTDKSPLDWAEGERSSPPTCWQHSCWCNKGCCLCWGGYCWLTFSCLSTRTLRTFFAKQLSGLSVLACNGAWGCSFSCAGYSLSRTLHFSLLNLTTFLSAHLSCLLMSFWMVAKLPGALTTPPSFVSGHL